jgi:hypothetical protein
MTTAYDLSKLYSTLKPEERFRLILAASSRGDYAEGSRLAAASKPLELKVQDYIPWALSFTEMAMIIFMELVELAAKHQDSLNHWCQAREVKQQASAEGDSVDDSEATSEIADSPEAEGPSEDDRYDMQLLSAYLAVGFSLKTKITGWKLFCERLNVPPFTIWKSFPGYDRFEAAMMRVEGTEGRFPAAFPPEAMLRFLQNLRPEGTPELSMAGLMSAEAVAKELDEMLRTGVKQFGG